MFDRLTTAPLDQPIRGIDDDTLVFAGFPTKSGEPSKLVFRQDVWHVNEIVLNANAHDIPFKLDFGRVEPTRIRVTLKEFAYARLRYAAGGYRAVKPNSVHSNTSGLIRVFTQLFAAEGINSVTEVNQAMLDRWLVRSQADGEPVEAHVYELKVLYAYRQYLSEPLSFSPWRGRTGKRVTGVRHGSKNPENKTPRIPETVAGPLLQWSFRYINDFSSEIITAVELALRERDPLTAASARAKEARLEAYLSSLKKEGRGLPSLSPVLPTDEQFQRLLQERRDRYASGWLSGRVRRPVASMSDAAILCAMNHVESLVSRGRSQAQLTARILQAADELSPEWRCAPPESLVALRRGSLIGNALAREMLMLVTAGFIVVAYLTGMRDSEVQDMRRGCLLHDQPRGAARPRWYVQSRVWKSRGVMGDPERWVAIDEVAKTVRVLERLHEAIGSPSDCYLFGRDMRGALTLGRADKPFGQRILLLLEWFREHVNALSQRSKQTGPIPKWEGRDWHFTSRQFRRTLAWHVVNRPFGTVAGMRHFKHVGIQIMEGYGGMSSSGFAAELEEERMLGSMDSLLDRYEDWERGVRLAGPGANVLEREFASIKVSLADGPMVADKARLRALLQHRSKHLYPGLLSDCSFDPNYALCGGAAEPRRDVCRPTRCANSFVTAEHKVRWLQHGQELDQYLAGGRRLPEGQVKRIKQARLDVAEVLGEPHNAPHRN